MTVGRPWRPFRRGDARAVAAVESAEQTDRSETGEEERTISDVDDDTGGADAAPAGSPDMATDRSELIWATARSDDRDARRSLLSSLRSCSCCRTT